MTREEVKGVLAGLSGGRWLIASFLCGAGLRLMECLRLRVQGLDFARNEILVRDGKDDDDLYACPQPRTIGRSQPSGHALRCSWGFFADPHKMP